MKRSLLIWPMTLASLVGGGATGADDDPGLTAVAGLKVGHYTLSERPTGVTVVLAENGAIGAVDVRGGSPGTREIALLDPLNSVEKVHAVVLAGGSAFGLEAATGVVRYLDERDIGHPTSVAKVPIVPAAILFDLAVGDAKIRPDADAGYKAAQAAGDGPVAEGSVGAGAGATVGKVFGMPRAMKGGVGSASLRLEEGPNRGLVVAALLAVNSVGDVVDPDTGQIVAGVRTADGKGLADLRRLIRTGERSERAPVAGENTTIGVVATNAALTKTEAAKVARMAHDGMARAIYPSHTPWDGDTIFVLATGTHDGKTDLAAVGALAADAVAAAIVRAARAAEGLPGLPAARDLDQDEGKVGQ